MALSLMDGLKTTMLLFFIVIICSLPLAFIITLLVRSSVKPVRYIFSAFIYVIRGTPLLLQLFFIYFGLPYIPIIGPYLKLDRFVAAVLGFTLNYAAYFAEIFRGGLLAVDKGQYEAAQVLGLNKFQTLIKVILPQMVRVALPSITNESITLVKDTSLLSALTVPDLLQYTKATVTRTADPSVYLIAAIIYLVMNSLLTFLFKKLERKLEF